MTKNEYKVGDRVRHLGYNLCGIITDFLGEGFVKVRAIDEEVFSTWDINNLELCDRKTAFLRELQALLRMYDARIYDGELYAIHIEVGYHSTKSEKADYLFYKSDNDEINADNIMDFDKE